MGDDVSTESPVEPAGEEGVDEFGFVDRDALATEIEQFHFYVEINLAANVDGASDPVLVRAFARGGTPSFVVAGCVF